MLYLFFAKSLNLGSTNIFMMLYTVIDDMLRKRKNKNLVARVQVEI